MLDLVWERLLEDLEDLEECAELGGVGFEWQAADGAIMGKARFGGTS